MPKRKEPELDPKEQFKRFQETAKELGVDESAGAVETIFAKLTKSQPAEAHHDRKVQKRTSKAK